MTHTKSQQHDIPWKIELALAVLFLLVVAVVAHGGEVVKVPVTAIVQPRPMVVFVHADSCGPCRAMRPIMAEVRKSITGVQYYEVQVEKEPQKAADYLAGHAIPAVVWYESQADHSRRRWLIGVQPVKEVVDFIRGTP